MQFALRNTDSIVCTDTIQGGQRHVILLVTDGKGGQIVDSYSSKEEAEAGILNLVDRYNIASEHGYVIGQHGHDIIFLKESGNESFTADAIDLNESLEDFEESLK